MRLIISGPAKRRLKEIHDYYKENVSIKLANKIRSGIIKRLKKIKANPLGGQKEEFMQEYGMEHRRIVEGNYKIIYRVSDELIYVTDIFDSRQDPSKMGG